MLRTGAGRITWDSNGPTELVIHFTIEALDDLDEMSFGFLNCFGFIVTLSFLSCYNLG